MGLDLGTKTLGVALSDSGKIISSPYKTLRYENVNSLIDEVLSIISEKSVDEIALGLPKNMDASLGPAAKRSENFKALLEMKTNVPITLVDERLTTVMAYSIIHLEGSNVKKAKKKDAVDMMAASVILEAYLKMKGNMKNGERK